MNFPDYTHNKYKNMTIEQIADFEKILAQLKSFYEDTNVLVKKNPKEEMNTFKLKLINKVLVKANAIVGDSKPFDDFTEFDIDGDMPNNSDVAMILGQYINCMEVIKKDNVHPYSGRWYWKTDKDAGSKEISTSAPADLKK